jgi:hypothetical protein
VSGEWLSGTQEGATDLASSSDVESPPLTPPLVSVGHDDDENMSDESAPSEETFEHQLDDIDPNAGNFFGKYINYYNGFISLSQLQINFQVAYRVYLNVSRSGMKEKT